MILKLLSLLPYWGGVLIVALIIGKKHSRISKDIVWASFRTTIQLILLAFALDAIFQRTETIVALGIAMVMTLNSSFQIVSRTSRPHFFWISLLSNIFSIWPVAFFFSWDKGGESWLQAKVLLPLLGMILGNSFNGVSTALNTYLEGFRERRNEVLSLLSLGATAEEATKNIYFRSLRAGLNSQINAMLAIGIVSIPGMMAGQLMSETSGIDASILQIKMMLSILIGTFLCISIALKFIHKKMFLPTGEICLE